MEIELYRKTVNMGIGSAMARTTNKSLKLPSPYFLSISISIIAVGLIAAGDADLNGL